MSGSVNIKGLAVFAYHGVLGSEKEQGQTFTVDVEMRCDLSKAAASDDLADAIDYSRVADLVVGVMTQQSFNLIETVADRVALAVVEAFEVESVGVTVHKPSAPVDHEFEDISVSVWRKRS